MSRGDPTDTGIPVYPRLPVPSPHKRDSEPALKKKSGGVDKKLLGAGGGALVAGAVLGFVVRPMVTTDARIPELETKVGEVTTAADAQKTRADDLDKQLARTKSEKTAAETKLTDAMKAQKELATRVSEAEDKAKAVAASKEKLQKVVDAQIGIVSADGDEITLRLVDKVMFKTLDDQLTDRGKVVLDKVAVALKEMSDKQIWVQGHTDDQPIVQPPPAKAPPPKKGGKPAPIPAVAGPKFATNWELSAARALTVVHYLQDTSKIEPSRLAALAFGQYRPVSKANKALNRRIEIVLYPKPVVKK